MTNKQTPTSTQPQAQTITITNKQAKHKQHQITTNQTLLKQPIKPNKRKHLYYQYKQHY